MTATYLQLIQIYIDHRVDVTRRRTSYKLRRAQQDAHQIEGLIYAVCDIDEVLQLIRSSQTRDEAIEKLQARGFRIPHDHPYTKMLPQRLLDMNAAAGEEGMLAERTEVMPLIPETGVADALSEEPLSSDSLDEFPLPEL